MGYEIFLGKTIGYGNPNAPYGQVCDRLKQAEGRKIKPKK